MSCGRGIFLSSCYPSYLCWHESKRCKHRKNMSRVHACTWRTRTRLTLVCMYRQHTKQSEASSLSASSMNEGEALFSLLEAFALPHHKTFCSSLLYLFSSRRIFLPPDLDTHGCMALSLHIHTSTHTPHINYAIKQVSSTHHHVCL